MTKCNGQRTFVARNQCNANEICSDNIKFSVYEMVNMYRKISKNRIINCFHFLPWTTRINAETTQSDFRNMVKPHFYAQIHLIIFFEKRISTWFWKFSKIKFSHFVLVRLLSVNWVLSHLTNWEPEEEQVKRARAVVHIRRSVFLLLPGAAAGGI